MKPPSLPQQFETAVSGAFDETMPCIAAWDELVGRSPTNTVFLTSDWLRAWCATLGTGARLIVPQVYLGGTLVAAAALQSLDGVIRFAADDRSDYADVLLSNRLDDESAGAAIDALLDAARGACDGFRHFELGRVQSTSRTLQLGGSARVRYLPTVRASVEAPYMDMSTVDQSLRKKSLRRHERRLDGMGALTSETYSNARDVLPQLDAFFDQHVDRWADTPSPSLFLDERVREFYRAVTRNFDTNGYLRFTAVRLDEQLIAAHFGFLFDGCFVWYKPSFAARLAKYSPGEVLLKRLLEQARAEQAGEFDFTIGNEAFKLRFATGIRQVQTVHITDSRWAANAQRLRSHIKTWAGRWRPAG